MSTTNFQHSQLEQASIVSENNFPHTHSHNRNSFLTFNKGAPSFLALLSSRVILDHQEYFLLLTHTLLFLPSLPCYTIIILWFPLLYTSSYGGYYITEVIMIVQKSPPPSCQMAIVSPPAFNNSPIEVTNLWHHSPLSQLIINQQC